MATSKSFQKRCQFYNNFKRRLSQRWQRDYHFIIAALYMMLDAPWKINTVVELGCADGRLAVQALHDLPRPVQWWGYDISEKWIKESQHHPFYTPTLIKQQLWELDIGRFNMFVSSHTLEHLFSDEVEQLVKWLGIHCNCGAVLSVPSPERVYGQHVLGKPASWIKNQFEKNGFRLVWESSGWRGWFVKCSKSYS